MARYLKFAALMVAALLLLLLAAAVVVRERVDPNDYKADIIRMAHDKHQRRLVLPDTIKLTLYPRVGAELGRIGLSERASEAEFAAVDSARIGVALLPLLLRQEVVIDHIELRGMRAKMIRHADGSTNTGDLAQAHFSGPATVPAGHGHAPLRVAIDSVRIDDAHIAFDDRKTGRTLDISHLHIDSGAIARGVQSKLAMSASIRSSRPALTTALTLTSQFMPDPARRRITFTDMEANLDLSLRDARASVSGKLDVDIDKDEFETILTGRLDESAFDVSAGLRGNEWHMSLKIDTLDLDRYRERSVPMAGAVPAAPAAPAVYDLSPLSSLRAAGGIEIGTLKAGALQATGVRAALRSDAGKLILQPIVASAYGGTLKGSLAFDFSASASTPRIALRQEMKAVQAGPLLSALIGKVPVQGKGDVVVDVATSGTTGVQMAEALSGSAMVRLAEGSINGIDIGAMLRAAKADQGLATAGVATPFSRLEASFTIASGIAHNADLLVNTPLVVITGAGDIDLARRQVDYTLASTLADPGPALPVRVNGPWEAITWQLDSKAISGAAVKAEARAKLKNTIRGLLKR